VTNLFPQSASACRIDYYKLALGALFCNSIYILPVR
jgi:hypothetical protein